MLNQKAFINKGIRCGYESLEFGRLLAHLSCENYEFSRRVAKKVIIMANKANGDEIEPCLNVLSHLLVLPDSLMP